MKNEELVRSFLENDIVCCKCLNHVPVRIEAHEGYWHLNGWIDSKGRKHYGQTCIPCFTNLRLNI